MIFLALSTTTPHICAIFLASNLGFWLPLSNPFSFVLVWFTLVRRQSLIFWVKLSTIRFLGDAEVLLDCCLITLLLLLATGFMGSLWDSSITPSTPTPGIGSKHPSYLYSSAVESSLLDVDERLHVFLNIGHNRSSVYSTRISNRFTFRFPPLCCSPLSMIIFWYLLIVAPCGSFLTTSVAPCCYYGVYIGGFGC